MLFLLSAVQKYKRNEDHYWSVYSGNFISGVRDYKQKKFINASQKQNLVQNVKSANFHNISSQCITPYL